MSEIEEMEEERRGDGRGDWKGKGGERVRVRVYYIFSTCICFHKYYRIGRFLLMEYAKVFDTLKEYHRNNLFY